MRLAAPRRRPRSRSARRRPARRDAARERRAEDRHEGRREVVEAGARRERPVEIRGTSADAATTVLASGTLPPGKYAFNAQVTLNGSVEANILCQARGPGSAGPL